MSLEHDFRPDFVFFTGDAAYGETPKESIKQQYVTVSKFFDQILNAFDPPLPKSSLFIVPGNHDVNRNEVSDAETQWLRQEGRTLPEIIENQQAVTKQWRNWMDRLTDYREFLDEYGCGHSGFDHPSLIWDHKTKINGISVGIVGLNSAWSCVKEDKGKIWMGGDWQVSELLKRIHECDIKIALTHHPGNWFRPEEDPALFRRMKREFQLVLHGHEHQSFIDPVANDHVVISAGAAYQCSWMKNGYNLGVISKANSSISIRLRRYDDDGGGWVKQTVADIAEDGEWRKSDVPWIKSLLSKPPTSDLFSQSESQESISNVAESASIITVEDTPDGELVQKRASVLRKTQLSVKGQHLAIRAAERLQFRTIVDQDRIVILKTDWQMGRDGFVASALSGSSLEESLQNVFRVLCGSSDDPDGLLDDIGAQLGLQFTEFAEIVNQIGPSILLLDDAPLNKFLSEGFLEDFLDKLKATVEFAKDLVIVVSVRDVVPEKLKDRCVQISAIEESDVRSYIHAHTIYNSKISDDIAISRIFHHTGGIPDAIDRLLSQTAGLTLDEILSEQSVGSTGDFDSPLLDSLKITVTRFSESTDEDSLHALRLLKLLTVLKDGETFDSVKRFFSADPFYPKHLDKLISSSLVISSDIAKSAGELLPSNNKYATPHYDRTKLLRVPPQVRDYINTLIDDDEREKIFKLATDTFFGSKWFEGKVSLRRSLYYAYKDSSISGPGNELVVVLFYLKTALKANRKDRIRRYANLAVGFCKALMDKDRFRDVVIVASSIRELLNERLHNEYWQSATFFLGKALRLTKQFEKSIQVHEYLLNSYEGNTKEFQASILFGLSSSYFALGEESEALRCAKRVLDLEENNSSLAIHTKSLICKIKLEGGTRIAALKSLFNLAKSKGFNETSNNIAMDIARYTSNKDESMKILDKVISSSKGIYSMSRAISLKAEILTDRGRLVDIDEDQRKQLCIAYAYSYGQRIDTIMDSCHDALWGIYSISKSKEPMLRLFKFSSFVWRLSGKDAKEKKYVQMEAYLLIDVDSLPEGYEDEYEYYKGRQAILVT